MADRLRRGFKSDAERIAIEVRSELDLDPCAPLDCVQLCTSLGIPVVAVPDLINSGASPKNIQRILSPTSRFSAMTIGVGTKRLIVYNPRHPDTRRASSLAHEVSHMLLEHPFMPALGVGGCRQWDATMEAEADWQAATLLVPRDAALAWLRAQGTIEEGAAYFGVSVPLFRWRLNQTGVVRQIEASRKYQQRF